MRRLRLALTRAVRNNKAARFWYLGGLFDSPGALGAAPLTKGARSSKFAECSRAQHAAPLLTRETSWLGIEIYETLLGGLSAAADEPTRPRNNHKVSALEGEGGKGKTEPSDGSP